MVKHVLLWQLSDALSGEDRRGIQTAVKKGLEALPGKVPGLVDVKVSIDPLETSNADIYLDATLTDISAVAVYQQHPEHLKVKDILTEDVVKTRLCMDYEISDWNAENLFREKK